MADDDNFEDDLASMTDMAEDDDISSVTGTESESQDNDDDEAETDFDMGTRIGHLSRAQIAELPPHEQLAKWFGTLLPIEADLITELDAANLFFIHAESMIFDLIESKEVSFENDTQFLTLIFAIEQLLSRVTELGGTFRLVFFDSSKKLFDAAFKDSVWGFRQALLVHCQSAGIDHAVFPHWYAPAWRDHVAQWRPSFFLVSSSHVELEEDEEDEDNQKLGGFFHALVLRCLSAKTHVALLRGLQTRGNRIMAFTLEPDCYDSFIDHNVQGSLSELFSDEDDDDDDEAAKEALKGSVKEALLKFQKDAGDKVDGPALLRSFLAMRFTKVALKQNKGQNAQTEALLMVVAKALLIQDMLLRQIPISKRSFSTFAVKDWTLFEESIEAALGRFFVRLARDLGALSQEGLPEGLPVWACDLFDGRMYRHIVHFIIEKGLKKKGCAADLFNLKPHVMDELNFLWETAGATEPFFPIVTGPLESLTGIKPPSLPPKLEPREQPELRDIKSEFLKTLEKFTEIKHVTFFEVEGEEEEPDRILCDKFGWKDGDVYLDQVENEEFMEKNEGEKKFEEKMKAKGKITAKDLEFKKKWEMKKRQMALKSLHAYSKSLTGSDKLHPPIISKEARGSADRKADKKTEDDKEADKKKEEADKKKVSAKMQELLDKRKAEEEAKIQEFDKTLMKTWDVTADALSEILDPEKLEKDLLETLLGFNRIIYDSFVGFPAVTSAFKTSEAQCKIVVKVIKNVQKSMKKMQLDRLAADREPQARRLVRYIFTMCQEALASFKKDIDGKAIKVLQEALIAVGFPKTAAKTFAVWKETQEKIAKEAAEAAAAAEKEKGGDKKKGKDDKKDDKKKDDKDKKDKKDKKDDKDKKSKKDDKDDKDDKDLDSFVVKASKVETVWSGVGEDEFAWQLQHMGPHMARTVGNAKDPKQRVMFRPDKWQRDLLDIVDSKESALISAPTASGKTFIGYYVMDQVLRNTDDGVAVYVAPSKALVNQVSAEIYARFSSKTYPAYCKNELLGVFIREFNSAGGVMDPGKWKNCQVLVTIPHVLEMLLLSPTHQDWVKRVKYIVFDEVHCIGGEDGLQWEHTMQLIPCPFVALSATVAQPELFHGWLEKVQKQKQESNKVNMVIHSERWNDLYKFIYTGGELRPLHPFCCLIEQSVRLQGLSADLTLTPMEMNQLHLAVARLIGAHKAWDKLAPVKYFSEECSLGFLSKMDARGYEKKLKALFLELVHDGTITSERFSLLQQALQCRPEELPTFLPPPRALAAPDEVLATRDKDFLKMSKGSSYMVPATLFKLCKDLDKQSSLPAIIFNFSRKEIDRMLTKLIQEMKDQQHNKYYGTEDAAFKSKKIMEARMADYNRKMTAWEQAIKMKASKNQEAKASRKNAEEGERGAVKDESADVAEDVGDEPVPPLDLADEIDLDFSFHSPKALGQWQEEIQDIFRDLKFRHVPDILIDGLKRGIGMHHEGARKVYKDAVEVLFRRNYLKVVFATGTLALGINMPCRTTIFCGDSLELNGLMFRQMAGRAGRRGFDLEGKVVFLDMAFLKIRSLVASDLSTLAGEFMLSPSTLLRTLHQWERVSVELDADKPVPRSKEEIARDLSAMFSLPFFRSKTADLETQVAYQTRFSADLLFQEGLLGPDGYTRSLANLATELFEVEPANLVICRLLSKGLLHSYLKNAKKVAKKGDRRSHLTVKLATILSWMLYRRRLPSVLPKERVPRKKHSPSEFCPELPPLPADIFAEICDFNAGVFEHVQQLSWTVSATRKLGEPDNKLPLSAMEFPVDFQERFKPFDSKSSDLAKGLIKQLTRYRARSPFSAVSGKGDNFDSIADLVTNSRNITHLDLNSFPSLALPSHGEQGMEPTNSWMLDFMIHGKIKYLWEDNGIGPTKAWKLINDFKEAVKKAKVALAAFIPSGKLEGDDADIVYKTFEDLHAEIERYLKGQGS